MHGAKPSVHYQHGPSPTAALAFADDAEKAPVTFGQDFEKVTVGEAPDDVMEIEGSFAVVEEEGKKFLRVGIEPLAENGIILGPSMKAGGSASTACGNRRDSRRRAVSSSGSGSCAPLMRSPRQTRAQRPIGVGKRQKDGMAPS